LRLDPKFTTFTPLAGSIHPETRMAFTATAATIGSPTFNVIDINPAEIAKALQTWLDRGSKLTGVSLDDIDRGVHTMPTSTTKVTLVQLLELGMKLFDALVWLSAGKPDTHPLQVNPEITIATIPSMHEVARAVFYNYFFMLTQARYPARTGAQNPSKVPNFLSVILGMDQPQGEYVATICSFEPQKFDPGWVKYVKFANFGMETISRFGLGVAGYRMFAPFKLYTVKEGLPLNILRAVSFAEKVAKHPPTWDVHPLTRNPAVLTNRGNLNKNCANLMLEVFTKEQLDEMVQSKVLFSYPVRDPTNTNYTQWNDDDDISGTTFIFQTSAV